MGQLINYGISFHPHFSKLEVHIARGELAQVSQMHAYSLSCIADQPKSIDKIRMVNCRAINTSRWAYPAQAGSAQTPLDLDLMIAGLHRSFVFLCQGNAN